MKNGQQAFILCGTALPDNFPVDSIKDSDEVWCARLAVVEVAKYEQSSRDGFNGTPEDFLEMMPDLKSEFCEWKKTV